MCVVPTPAPAPISAVKPEKNGYSSRGIGVQRHEAHVVAVVEDLLGAVAVVVVDVEHRHPRAAIGPRRRGDRGVVEEAVAGVRVGRGVVAGRPRERVRGRRVAVGHGVPRAQRHVDRADRRGPRAGEDRVVVVRVPTERGDRMAGASRAGWPRIGRGVRHRFARLGGARRGAPAGVRVLEELDVVGGVHAQDGSRPCSPGAAIGPNAGVDDRGADALGALGHLGRVDHVPLVVERLAGMMLTVRVGREREHAVAVARTSRRPVSAATGRYPRCRGARDRQRLDASISTSRSRSSTRCAARSTTPRCAPRPPAATTRCATATSSRTARLRSILGARLGIEPGAVEISRRCARCGDPAHGKPEVGPAGRRRASRSACRTRRRSRWSRSRPARASGIDIEVERPRARLDALAARVLGVGGARRLARCWSRPRSCTRSSSSGRRRRRTSRRSAPASRVPLRDVPVEPDGWTVTGFPSPPGVVARVAVEGYARRAASSGGCRRRSTRPARGDPNRPIDKFRGTAVGSVLAAGLLGLRDALEPARDEEVAIVQDYSGDPPFTDPIVLRLDPDHPEDSIVMVRPWLRDKPDRSRRASRAPTQPPRSASRPALAELIQRSCAIVHAGEQVGHGAPRRGRARSAPRAGRRRARTAP